MHNPEVAVPVVRTGKCRLAVADRTPDLDGMLRPHVIFEYVLLFKWQRLAERALKPKAVRLLVLV